MTLTINKTQEITKDLANAIVEGDTMVPICSVGPLLQRIEALEFTVKQLCDKIEDGEKEEYYTWLCRQ